MLKDNAINKIKELNNRLTYINRINDYKERHPELFIKKIYTN